VTSEPNPSNLFDPGFAQHPYPQFAALSVGNPVQQTPLGLWALFGYDDAVRLLRDPSLSVEDRIVVGRNPRAEVREQILGDRPQRGTHQILNLDPPDHTRLRKLVQQVFTPRMVEQLAPRVQVMVDDALDAVVARGDGMDVIADLAFPAAVPGDLGHARHAGVRRRSCGISAHPHAEPRAVARCSTRTRSGRLTIIEHVLDAISGSGPIRPTTCSSALIAAEDSGDRLSPEELLDQVILLYIAGHETTVNLIGNGTHALLTHRSQLERWRDDPALDANAVDELLRYDCPVQFSRRITTSALQVGDATIERGVFVLTCLAAANRDSAKWGATAQDLDLGRPGVAQHLAFGSGIHHCLGAALARLEGRIAMGTLIRRFPGLEPTGDTPAWNGRLVLRGLDFLPVTLGG
jgi:cytochrome P450